MPKISQKNLALSPGVFRPQELVAQLGIEAGMRVADFGSGAGDFAILLAKIVGKSGRISAIDIKEGAVQSVQSRARFFGLNNITAIHSDLEIPNGSKLPDESQDAVLYANILFQAKNKESIIQEALRILKTQGRCIIIEWKSDSTLGPHAAMRMSSEALKELIEKQGFQFVKEFQAGNFHFGLIFTKP